MIVAVPCPQCQQRVTAQVALDDDGGWSLVGWEAHLDCALWHLTTDQQDALDRAALAEAQRLGALVPA